MLIENFESRDILGEIRWGSDGGANIPEGLGEERNGQTEEVSAQDASQSQLEPQGSNPILSDGIAKKLREPLQLSRPATRDYPYLLRTNE